MRVRLPLVLVLALLALPASAAAQVPTPTPSPTPTPTATPTPTPVPERSDAVKRVYRDYRRDGVVDACTHKRRALEKTLDQLTDRDDTETPDLRPALEAGIEQHESGDCERRAQQEEQEEQAAAQEGNTGSGSGTIAPVVPAPVAPAPTPLPTPLPTPAPSSGSTGSVAPLDRPSRSRRRSRGRNDVTPLAPEVTPVPPAVAPVEPSGPVPTPQTAYANADDAVPLPILLLAGLLAVLALLALLYAAISRLGWGDARLDAFRRASREAAFRAGGTWGDFADWIRVGR